VHGQRLPFLLKVLAVERPLSLQAHPDREQAQSGFARQPAGAGLYADPFSKPELVCALTRFTALCGFLPVAEIRARFAAVGLDDFAPAGRDEAEALARFLGGWLERPTSERLQALRRALDEAAVRAERERAFAHVRALAALHPDDPAVLAPLFLHEVELAPGEALYLEPGVPHAYLGGVGLELMASSDNVLRGGLTTKPVHVGELLRVLRFTSGAPQVLRSEPRGAGEGVFRTCAEEFELSELRPATGAPVVVASRASVEILWCAEGALRVERAGGGGLDLARGESCLVPAKAGPYRVCGAGRAFRAGLPLARAAQGGAATRRRGDACGS
jgi:mannose-6-phosphate isomerase